MFLKRHKVNYPQAGRDYNWRDFEIGMEIDIYGRVFKIVDADDFTRRFYANEGTWLGSATPYPEDSFAFTW